MNGVRGPAAPGAGTADLRTVTAPVDQIDPMPGATVSEMLGAAGQQSAAFVLIHHTLPA